MNMKSRSIGAWLSACGLVAILSLPRIAAAQTTAYTNTGANLRAGPDIGYPLVQFVPYDTVVQVYGCTDDYAWCDVSVDDFNRGWMPAAYLEYYDAGEPQVVSSYGVQIGVPIVSFLFVDYWNTWYRHRNWYAYRHRWAGYRPPPRPPIPPPHRPPPPHSPQHGMPPSNGNWSHPPMSDRPPSGNRLFPPGGGRPLSPTANRPNPPSANTPPQSSRRPPQDRPSFGDNGSRQPMRPPSGGHSQPSFANRPVSPSQPPSNNRPQWQSHPMQEGRPPQNDNGPRQPKRLPVNPSVRPAQPSRPAEPPRGGGHHPSAQAHDKSKHDH